MRQEDRDECLAAGGERFLQGAYETIQGGENYAAWSHKGELLACGGYRPDGLVWLLCTAAAACYQRAILKRSKRMLAVVRERHPGIRLFNAVWQGNPLHIRWLQHLGAVFACRNHSFIRFTL
jgi:hypothetical protein